MRKKLMAITLVTVMALTLLAGCGKKTSDSQSKKNDRF